MNVRDQTQTFPEVRFSGNASGRPLAVITGASTGIGFELARQFASNGYDLLIVSNSDVIMSAAEPLRLYGVEVNAVRHDLSDETGVDAFLDEIRWIGRPLAAVVLNAGVGVGGKFYETDLCQELDMIRLNVLSTVHLSKHIVQYMIDKGEGGKLLFTSSVAADTPGPYEAVYAATKAFVQSFALALRHELEEKGIQITVLKPGPTDTNFFHRAGMDNTKVAISEKDDPAEVAREGFEALLAEKSQIVAGSMKNHLLTTSLIPEAVRISQHADMTKPGGASNVQDRIT